MNIATAAANFQTEIIAKLGADPGPIISDGRIHRVDVDKKGDKVGWYVSFSEGVPAGAFGNWKNSITYKWSSKNGQMSAEEQAVFKQQVAKAEKKRTVLKKKARKRAQKLAKIIWNKAKKALEDHPYLITKQIKPHGARQYKTVLIIPVLSLEDKEISSLQFIHTSGTKRFLKGCEIKGNLFWISGDNTLCLCEGFSTGASIFESTGHTVLISFNAGNLEPVAEQIRAKYPNRPLIICGDNDAFTTKADGTPWNPGREKALAVAWKHNVKVVLPSFHDTVTRPTDFNDLMVLEGCEAVRKQLSKAKHAPQVLLDECEENKGAAFRSEHLGGLNELKKRDLPEFRGLRHKLKKLEIGVMSLDDAMSGKTADNTNEAGDGSEHLDSAMTVIQSFGDVNLLYHQSFFWIWNKGGLWMKSDDKIFKKSIHTCIKGVNFRKSDIDSILDMAKTEVFLPDHRFDINTSAINCLNGELHWIGSRWELKEHKREHYRTTQIPIEYDPKATAERFEQFLLEIFQDDSDQIEKAFLVCELLGYSLLSSTEYEKFILLIGSGANGKSVLMETLASLVGREHVAAVQPSQFDNRFQRAHLHCKLVNLVTEIAEGHTIQDAELKSIVSGELTTAEHKHKPPFDFQPYSTCWFGSNHMPHTRDFSDALFRRAIIIPFNRTFQEHAQDKHLKSKLKEELTGILNLALEAIAGVLKRGEFTKTTSCEKAKREWRLNCDQVQQFAVDECLFIPGIETASGKLFKTYRQWAEDSGIKRTVNRNNFTARMCRLGAERAKGTGGTRLLAGVGLKRHVE